jgi:hypothetical protein
LKFQPLRLDDIEALVPYFRTNLRRVCDCTLGGTFMWRDFHKTEFAIEDGILYLKAEYSPGMIAFAPPRGAAGSTAEMCRHIISYCRENDLTPRLCAVSGHFHDEIRALYPDAREQTNPDWSDYLYVAEDIATLAGRRYSGQRNHINKFLKQYDNWRFERVDSRNSAQLAAVRDFFVSYSRDHEKDYLAYDEGNIKAIEVIDNLDRYGQLGGILYVGDDIVGAAFGEIVGDTLFVHSEKALTEYDGAYPMLVREYAKMFANGEVRFINREEDDGVPGLRTSKLSYHPCTMLEKYVVEL